MKLGFVFPGQGCQWVGMGKDLFTRFPEARAVFDAADDALGENSALVATGSLSLGSAVRAVRDRGRLMKEAVPAGVGAMAAVLGLPADQVGQVCIRLAQGRVLSPANYNSPEQTVIAGHADAVEGAAKPMQEAGAKRVIPLQVSAPFHCALMEPVKPLLKEILKDAAFAPPRSPVVTNVEAKPNSDPNRTLPLLLEQVSQPVRWVECVEEMRRQGVTHFVELGPGKVLRGLIKQISKDTPVFGVEDAQSLERALAGVSGG